VLYIYIVCPERIRLGIILVVSGKHASNDRHLLLRKLQAVCFNKIFINRLELELARLFTIFQEDINPKTATEPLDSKILFKKSACSRCILHKRSIWYSILISMD
jgi:hypothetical protein